MCTSLLNKAAATAEPFGLGNSVQSNIKEKGQIFRKESSGIYTGIVLDFQFNIKDVSPKRNLNNVERFYQLPLCAMQHIDFSFLENFT